MGVKQRPKTHTQVFWQEGKIQMAMNRLRLLAPLVAIGASTRANAQTTPTIPGNYVKANGDSIEFAIPAYVERPILEAETVQGGKRQIRLTFSQPVQIGGARVLVEVFFDDPNTADTRFDCAAVAALGTFQYESNPATAPGTGAVVSMGTYRKKADVEVSVQGNVITLKVPTAATFGATPNLVRLRWVPASVPMSELTSGLNSISPFYLYASPEFDHGSNFFPRVPFAHGRAGGTGAPSPKAPAAGGTPALGSGPSKEEAEPVDAVPYR